MPGRFEKFGPTWEDEGMRGWEDESPILRLSELIMELKKQKVYKKVFDLACERLIHSDVEKQLGNAGLRFEIRGKELFVEIPFFDESITLLLPGCIFKSSRGVNVTLVSRIVILHYIASASGVPNIEPGMAGEIVAERLPYEDVPGCRHYQPVYEKRVTKPLEAAFGFNRDAFLGAGLSLGGSREEYGDASFTLRPFPRVPVTFVLWEGDEEFPPSVKVLFDPSVPGYLPLEDIVVISKLAATRITKQARLKAAEEYTG
jgi:hypothetical protein